MRALAIGLALALAVLAPVSAQQVPDPDVDVTVARPAFAIGAGPVVAIDGYHRNFHTIDGRYAPFAALLTADGFRVKGLDAPLSAQSLSDVAILVIANASPPQGSDPAALVQQSAFTPDEIAAVKAWVQGGGSLFLIADHMPFAGASTALGEAFGFGFRNGYVAIPRDGPLPDLFTRDNGLLGDDAVTRAGGVVQVGTFTGSGFTAPAGARPILTLPAGARLLTPDDTGAIRGDGPSSPVGGLFQGAVMNLGKGRVAVFGEAAMFTAQLAGPQRQPIGFNNPGAPQNKLFLLNLLHWLAGALPD